MTEQELKLECLKIANSIVSVTCVTREENILQTARNLYSEVIGTDTPTSPEPVSRKPRSK